MRKREEKRKKEARVWANKHIGLAQAGGVMQSPSALSPRPPHFGCMQDKQVFVIWATGIEPAFSSLESSEKESLATSRSAKPGACTGGRLSDRNPLLA